MLTTLIVVSIIAYIVIAVFVAAALDNHEIESGFWLLIAGLFWPVAFFMYRWRRANVWRADMRYALGAGLIVLGLALFALTLGNRREIREYKALYVKHQIETAEKVVQKPVPKAEDYNPSERIVVQDTKIADRTVTKSKWNGMLPIGFYQIETREGRLIPITFCLDSNDTAPNLPVGSYYKSMIWWIQREHGANSCAYLEEVLIDRTARW